MASTAFDQDRRNVLELDELTLAAFLAFEERSHQLRLQLVGLKLFAAAIA